MASLYKMTTEKNEEDKPTRYFSKKQEKKVAKAVGGKTTANSGATAFSKGDVLTDKFVLECKTKTTDSKSISVKKEWIEKNIQEMVFMGKDYQAIVISFGPGQPNYYIIDELTFQEFLEYLNNKEE